MKKLIRRVASVLCIAMILSVLAACTEAPETESKAESSTASSEASSESAAESIEESSEQTVDTEETTVEETYETELVEDLVTFVDYTRSSRGYHNLKTSGNAAMSFTIPDGQMKKLFLNLTDKHGYVDCSIQVDIYSFTGNYRSTLETDPIYSEYITSTLRTYTIVFEDGQMPAGDYLVVLSYVEPEIPASEETESDSNAESESETEPATPEVTVHCQVIQDYFWYEKTIPEEYKQYDLRSYMKDKANKKNSFCGGFVIEHNVIKEEEITAPEEEYPEYPENTAKVILIGGQSNATGATVGTFLKQNVTDEKYQEYVNGYSNVKIFFSSGALASGVPVVRNKSNEFVDAKLGQGIGTYAYGPELGLAAYLSATYPDETFYIIKYAIGSSGLYAHWNPLDEELDQCLVEFKETVDTGLELLEDEGLDPRIVAFLWMQGEGDASTAFRAHEYYELQKALLEDIRSEYAFYEAFSGIAFIDAAVSESGIWSTSFIVNECKRQYAKDSHLNFFIDTNAHGLDTLQENNDPAHYDSTSMILLGELFGIELSKVLD